MLREEYPCSKECLRHQRIIVTLARCTAVLGLIPTFRLHDPHRTMKLWMGSACSCPAGRFGHEFGGGSGHEYCGCASHGVSTTLSPTSCRGPDTGQDHGLVFGDNTRMHRPDDCWHQHR